MLSKRFKYDGKPIIGLNELQVRMKKQIEKKSKGISRFERYLSVRGINHIPSKRNNPQTNGKIERWFQEYRRHRWRFDGAYAFAEWYNNRIHGALDLECGETPNEAFVRKLRSGSILGMFLEWNEREVSL